MLPPPPPPLPQEENNTSQNMSTVRRPAAAPPAHARACGERRGRGAERQAVRYSRDSVGVRQQCGGEREQQRRAAGARPERAHGARVECGRPGGRARRTAAAERAPPPARRAPRRPLRARPGPRSIARRPASRHTTRRPADGDTSDAPAITNLFMLMTTMCPLVPSHDRCSQWHDATSSSWY